MEAISRDFIERMGLLVERQGSMSRIAGRMLAYFMLDGTPRTLDEIREDLQISKASASINARLLEQLGLLDRCSAFGDRRDYYRIGEAPWENMFAVARRRFEQVVSILDHTKDSMPDEMDDARRRLARWAAFYHFMIDDIDERAARWRELLQESEATVDAN